MVIFVFIIDTRQMTKVCVFCCNATTSKASPGYIKNIIPARNLIDCFILPFQKFLSINLSYQSSMFRTINQSPSNNLVLNNFWDRSVYQRNAICDFETIIHDGRVVTINNGDEFLCLFQ